jgi:ABC-2 type transport system permease protein
MKSALRFAISAVHKNILNSAELRTSFISNVVGMMLNNSFFVVIWIFFVQAVGEVNGWTAIDIIGMQGFGMFSFGLVFSLAAGFSVLPNIVSSGAFDTYLLAPQNLLLRVALAHIRVSALGDAIFGAVCLSVYFAFVIDSLPRLAVFFLVLGISTLVHLSVVIFISAFSFFFNDPKVITTGLFDVFITPTLFHGGAIQGAARFFLMFVIPALLIGTLPVEAVREPTWGLLITMFAIALFWLWLCIRFFNYAVRRYESGSLFSFGN